MRRIPFIVFLAAAYLVGLPSVGEAQAEAAPVGGDPTAFSDFNGDGFADLAIGVPYENVGSVSDAGAVNVLYGSGGGLQATSPDDQFWTQNSPGVRGTAKYNDQFGKSVAAGDFNHDGFADLAIGVAYDWVPVPGGITFGGAVQVLYGSAGGLQATAPDDRIWHQNSAGVRGTAGNDEAFGASLGVGDFNKDGFADLAIDVLQEAVGGEGSAGAVEVLYGSSGGLQATTPDDQLWTQNSPGVLDTAEAVDLFGFSLGPGDFNNDGFMDLAIGVPGEAVIAGTAGQYNGAVSVLYGSAGGLQATAPVNQFWNQDSPGVLDTAEYNDEFGRSLASGDFNNDGFSDLAVGVPLEDVLGASGGDSGAVNVLYGWAGGIQATAPDDQFWNQDSPSMLDMAESGDQFGHSLRSGDYNGDGFADVSIGARVEALTDLGEGAVSVLYGSASGVQAASPDDQFWNQDSPGVLDTAEVSDGFGSSLGGGDFNNDGSDDLAIGAVGESIGGASNAGAVNVLYGSTARLQATSPDDQFWNQDSPGVQDTAESQDSFGTMDFVCYFFC